MALITRVPRLSKADLNVMPNLDEWSDGIDMSQGAYLKFR